MEFPEQICRFIEIHILEVMVSIKTFMETLSFGIQGIFGYHLRYDDIFVLKSRKVLVIVVMKTFLCEIQAGFGHHRGYEDIFV